MEKTIIISQNMYSKAYEYLFNEIKSLLDDSVNRIVSNGNICSTLEESPDFVYESHDDINGILKIGSFSGIDLYVDSHIKWSDSRIIFMNDDKLVHEMKVIDEKMMLL